MHRRIAEAFFVVSFIIVERKFQTNVSETMWNRAENFSHEFFIVIFNKRLKTQTRIEIRAASMHSNESFNFCELSQPKLWEAIPLAAARMNLRPSLFVCLENAYESIRLSTKFSIPESCHPGRRSFADIKFERNRFSTFSICGVKLISRHG